MDWKRYVGALLNPRHGHARKSSRVHLLALTRICAAVNCSAS